MDAAGELFQAAVSALFLPHEHPVSLFYSHGEDDHGALINLRAVQDPASLPQFWTLSCPRYIDAANLQEDYYDFKHGDGTRTLQQTFTNGDGLFTCEAFIKYPPFLVFEIDYLLCDKDNKNLTLDVVAAQKQLQADALAIAFQQSKFPFAVLVHSGSKSIHAYVRLSDSLETVADFRSSDQFKVLQELAWTVFGHYDQSVMKESGRVRLVRTPGATRINGDGTKAVQQILAVGAPTTINALFQWFYTQLSPQAVQDIISRAPIPKQSPLRTYWLRTAKWRHDVAQAHEPGERGTHWFHVSKSLALAGCREPRMLRRPQQPNDRGEWDAPWLWWVSAVIFDRYARGWFFSCDPKDWTSEQERVRWWDGSTVTTMVGEQRAYEKFNPEVTALADILLQNADEVREQQKASALDAAVLPAVALAPGAAAPTTHQGGITGDQAPVTSAPSPPPAGEKKEKEKLGKKGIDYNSLMQTFKMTEQHMANLITMSKRFGGQHYIFTGKIWEETSKDYILSRLHHGLMKELPEKHKIEVVNRLTHEKLWDTLWQEKNNAVAFNNGTLRIDARTATFAPSFDMTDGLRSIVPFDYNEQAQCPQWMACMERFLPDEGRRAVIQEMIGYTLLPGQPFQAFFLLLGSGANFKGTLLRIIEAMHGEAATAVSVATLGGKFALGAIGSKRVAIDGDADQLGSKANASENAIVTSVIKAWTGGDALSVEMKGIQAVTARMNPKLILAANKRPRLVDSTNGLWRRLKIIKFDVTIDKSEVIADYHTTLIAQEMPGIINWAIAGLRRLIHHQRFTSSTAMDKDAEEYKEDMDSVLRFVHDYMEPDPVAGWHDIRPIYTAYKAFCDDTGSYACGEAELIERMKRAKMDVQKPEASEVIHMAVPGSAPVNGHHYWALRGWRCRHHALQEIPTQGVYPKTSAGPIQFPLKVKS